MQVNTNVSERISTIDQYAQTYRINSSSDNVYIERLNKLKYPGIKIIIPKDDKGTVQIFVEQVGQYVSSFFSMFTYESSPKKESPAQSLEERKFFEIVKNQQEIFKLTVKISNQISAMKTEPNQKKVLELQYSCDITMLELLAMRCDLLKTMMNVLSKDKPIEPEAAALHDELAKSFKDTYNEISKMSQEIKQIRHVLIQKSAIEQSPKNKKVQASFTSPDDFTFVTEYKREAEIPISIEETWHRTNWGRLLLPASNTINDIKGNLGVGFTATIEALKKQKRELQKQFFQKEKEIDDLKKKPSTEESVKATIEKEEISAKIDQINKATYHTILLRLIDVVGQKVNQKDNNNDPVLDQEIKVLNKAYDKILVKYRNSIIKEEAEEKKQNKAVSMASKFIWDFFDKAVQEISAFAGTKYLTPAELSRNFEYAIKGYNMKDSITKYLNSLELKYKDKSLQYAIVAEVEQFLSWADSHPWTASELASNVAVSYSLITNAPATDALFKKLEVKAMTKAFTAGLYNPIDKEPIETEEQLQYRALSEISAYLPMAAGVGRGLKNFLEKDNWSLLGLGQEVAKGLLVAAGIQTISHLTPKGYEDVAMSLAQIMKGDDVRQILDKRAELASVQIAGEVKNAVRNPRSVIQKIKKSFLIWGKTLKASKKEAFALRVLVQVVLPTVTLIASAGVVVLAAFGIALTMGAAIPIAAGILGAMWSLNYKLYNAVNYYDSESLSNVNKELENKEKENYKKVLLAEQAAQINEIKEGYIRNLAPTPFVDVILNEKEIAFRNAYEAEIKNSLISSLNQAVNDLHVLKNTPGTYLKVFRDHIMINDNEKTEKAKPPVRIIGKEINDRIDSNKADIRDVARDYLASKIKDDLIKDWLDGQLTDAIADLCFDCDLLVREKDKNEVIKDKKTEMGLDTNLSGDVTKQAAITEADGFEKFLKSRMLQRHGVGSSQVEAVIETITSKNGLNRPLL